MILEVLHCILNARLKLEAGLISLETHMYLLTSPYWLKLLLNSVGVVPAILDDAHLSTW